MSGYQRINFKDQVVERPKTYDVTNNPDGSITLIESFGNVEEIGTPINSETMGHIEDALEEHDNRITVLENASDYDNFLTKSQITNCITEIPQNIKLELNNGTLTLKAGSKVTVPNGVGVFDEVTIAQDISYPSLTHANADRVVFVNISTNMLNGWGDDWVFSGSTAPSPGVTAYVWYDTANNVVKSTGDGGSTWSTGLSLPICIGNYVKNSGFTSINQIFNGIGYIGSHIWIDKGVKLLIADGYNEDGTIKNEEIVTPNVIVSSAPTGGTRADILPFLRKHAISKQLQIFPISKAQFLGELDYVPTVGAIFQYYFNTNDMKWYMHEANQTSWINTPYYIISPLVTVENSRITEFKPYKPFRAVDYNDLPITSICKTKATTSSTATQTSPAVIVQNYVNGTSWYRVWSDGWIEQGGQTQGVGEQVVTFLKPFSNTNYTVFSNLLTSGAVTTYTVTIHTKQTNSVCLYAPYNAEIGKFWCACGY